MRKTLAVIAILAIVTIAVATVADAQLGRVTPQIEITSDHVDGLMAAQEIREVLQRYDVRIDVELVYQAGRDPRPRVRLVKLAHAQ